jgi:Type I phosphodiesterase / nucleotide pyrophosphatase
MTELPESMPALPQYGAAALSDLASSVLAALGTPDEANPLGLPSADRVCLLVVDGLGWELLREHPAAAPFLSELAVAGRPLTAGFPATTATSLASLGTGRPPGQHGLLGYQVAVPGAGRLLNALRWDKRVDPVVWQPTATIFERAAAAGIGAFRVAQSPLERTGLSEAAMRGAEYRGADTLGALVAETATALRHQDRALAMVYHGDLDATGHVWGCGSDAWRYHLGHVDKLAEQLASALPPGTTLYITADHGMVDIGPQDKIDADALPELRAGVALLGGEPRARHVYAEPGAAADVLAAWRETLGPRAWVASRDEAVADGWFGPVEPAMADRIGDVVAAPAGSWALVATVTEPRESALIGMHGSLTFADQLVPLLTWPPDGEGTGPHRWSSDGGVDHR